MFPWRTTLLYSGRVVATPQQRRDVPLAYMHYLPTILLLSCISCISRSVAYLRQYSRIFLVSS